jgi:CheY-like chemotaxis protein
MPRKVLFVDDDQVLQRVMQSQLAEVGTTFSLVTANDGFEALKKLEESYYSLVVVDLVMPRMDGMSLFVHIKKNYPDVAVIMVSEKENVQISQLIESSGAIGMLEKPYLPADLSELILSSLRKEADGGVMYNVSPPVFLQLMEMDSKTCSIRLIDEKSEQGGVLYFAEGELLDARIGEFKGLEATYCLFGWDNVTVFIRNDCPLIDNAINSDLQAIILKAVGLKDEAEELHADLEDQSSPAGRLKKLIEEEESVGAPLEILSPDKKIKNVISKLAVLSESSGFDGLQSAFIHNGGNVRTVILPSQQTVVQGAMSPSLSDKIVQLLRSNS